MRRAVLQPPEDLVEMRQAAEARLEGNARDAPVGFRQRLLDEWWYRILGWR